MSESEQAHSIWVRDPELDKRLRELVALGLSYGKISGIMGLTRNQVIGRAVRLKLEKPKDRQFSPPEAGWKITNTAARERHERSRQQAKVMDLGKHQTPASAPRKAPSVELFDHSVVRIEDFVPESARRGITDLRDTQCRWTIGDPQKADFHFCHRDQIRGLPYCEAHFKRSQPVVVEVTRAPEFVASRLPEVPKPTIAVPEKETAD
jgi:GcrA cell cycle regulator